MRTPKTWKQLLILAAILIAVWAWDRWIEPGALSGGSSSETGASPPTGGTPGTGTATADPIRVAFERGRGKRWVEHHGVVTKILRDDDDPDGGRHQKFLIRSPSGVSVLVAHNIDIADRVPLSKGDAVSFRGEYVWTEKGGTLHWTHRPKYGNRQGGWIEHAGKRYR